ncbi:unnamed protein product, partial [Prorocentrum cordatum]
GLPDISWKDDNEGRARRAVRGGRRGSAGRADSTRGRGSSDQMPGKKDTKIVDLGELDDGEMDVAKMQKFFPVMMRLLLNLAQRGRVRAWTRAAEGSRANNNKQQSDETIKPIGTISVTCYADVFQGLLAEGNAVGRVSQQNLETLASEQAKLTVAEMGEVVPLAKTTNCYKEGKVKLILAFSGRLNMAPVLDSLIQAGADYKQGMAPMGHLERLIHTGLQELDGAMFD